MSVYTYDVLDYNIFTIFKTEKDVKNILTYDEEPSYSIYPNMPLFKYGFHYYIHQTKNKTEIFEKNNINDIQKIVNPFEDTIPDNNYSTQYKTNNIQITDDIKKYSLKYFNTNRIACRAFYKLWEILMIFNIINDEKNIKTLHLAEAPGSFAQAVIYYRNKLCKKESIINDKYIAMSIDSNNTTTEEINDADERIPYFYKGLNKYKNFSIWSYKNSDLTKLDIINKFVKEHENTANIITADGGLNWKDENYQEQEIYLLLLAEIYCAIKCQIKGGKFIIKIYETFTELTVKIIEILKQFYKDVYICKPLLSRPSNSERYLVCLDFYTDNNKYIYKIYNIIESTIKNNDKYLIEIFPNYSINSEFELIIKLLSYQLANIQHKQINEMINYINNGNYYGDEYKKYLNKRKEANDFWINIFYPLIPKELNNNKKIINKIINDKLELNNKLLNDLKSILNL